MKRFRWFIVALAFLACIITYLDRTALSYAVTPIEQTFHLNNTAFGGMAAAFGVGYLAMTVIGGLLVDRFGSRKIWSIFGICWSISCALIGLATGFFWLFVFRLLLGLSEGPSFPALTRVVADWLPQKERARALALSLAAVPFASVLGAPFIAHLIVAFGWRIMFIILGCLGVIWVCIWCYYYRDKPNQSHLVTPAERKLLEDNYQEMMQEKSTRTSWRYLLTNRVLLTNNYAFFAFGYLLFFAITWLPGYLEQTYHMQLQTVGWFLIAPWFSATIFILLGGMISDWLWKKTKTIRASRTHLIWICQILSVLCFLPVVFSHSQTMAILGITFGVAFGLMPNSAFYAINADLAFDKAATSLGIMDGAFALAGILAPFLTGWLASLLGNFSGAILLMMLLTLSSALAVFLFQRDAKSVKN